MSTPPSQIHNPLHGLTLEAITRELVDFFGWEALGERIPIRCFQSDPSLTSSLKFLRKTPWARSKVESLYLFMQREKRRQSRSHEQAASDDESAARDHRSPVPHQSR